MNEFKKLKKKVKKEIEEDIEIDEDSEYPVHEKYVKEKKIKKMKK